MLWTPRGEEGRGSCTKKNVRKDWIDGLVLLETKLLLFDDELMDLIAENTYRYYVEANTDTAYTDALQANLQEKVIEKRRGLAPALFFQNLIQFTTSSAKIFSTAARPSLEMGYCHMWIE